MAFEVIAVVTNETKVRQAVAHATGKSFKVTSFSLGDRGHDPTDPTLALTPDPTETECNSGYPVVFGPKAIDGYTLIGTFCPQFRCSVSETEVVGVITQVCLIAEIVYSPIPGDPEVGDTFLYAIANRPYWVKTSEEGRIWLISPQF